MSAVEVVALVAAAVDAIARLITAGVSHSEALERIRSIASDARSIEADVDRVAAGA